MASDGWLSIKHATEALSVRELVTVGKMLKDGPLGFDYQKCNKATLQSAILSIAYKASAAMAVATAPARFFAMSKAQQDDVVAHFNNLSSKAKAETYAAILALINSTTVAAHASASEPEAPESDEPALFEDEPETDPSALAEAIAKAVAAATKPKGPTLNLEAVRRIIKDEIAQQTTTYRVEVALPEREPVVTGEEPRHELFPKILKALALGLNVMVVGPAGCGKTHLGEQLAKSLGLDLGISGAVGFEHKLTGFIDAHGQVIKPPFRNCYENGGLMILDEFDGSSPNAALSINSGLANGHQDFPDGVIKRHPNFRVVVFCNTFGHGADRQYVGRNQLDVASLDRFFVLAMDYDEKLERTLYGDTEWTRYVQKARASLRQLKIRHIASMRAIEMGSLCLANGMDRETIEQAVLWKHLSKDDVAKVKANMGA